MGFVVMGQQPQDQASFWLEQELFVSKKVGARVEEKREREREQSGVYDSRKPIARWMTSA